MSYINTHNPTGIMTKTKDQPRRYTLPLLPLRDMAIFPHSVVPLVVGRPRSIAALEEAERGSRELVLAAQKQADMDDPALEDIHAEGTLGEVIQLLRLADGTAKVLVKGRARVSIERFLDAEGTFFVEAVDLEQPERLSVELEALARAVRRYFTTYHKLSKKVAPELHVAVQALDDPAQLADTLAAHLPLSLEDRQALLAIPTAMDRLERLHLLMQREVEVIQHERVIHQRVKKQMDRHRKGRGRPAQGADEASPPADGEAGLQQELMEELRELQEQVEQKDLPEHAREKVDRELRKLKMMAPMSPEATVVRQYIETVLDLPWVERTDDRIDLARAEKILDEDHHGLVRVKERILEHLAVQTLSERLKGPILCLVGPPGVGKTSLGRAIARAMGRRFARLSLGGVRDEAEIRGHRRTYVGALPGKIIQSLRKARSANPLFLLDEVDKMSADFRGDPASALLEVLDPEQNHTFNDHYLELDYDLSSVMFLTTANTMQSIPLPLLDRMEVIRLPGYTEEEKLTIARQHLVPRQRSQNGLKVEQLSITDGALRGVICGYTREAGVRELERQVGAVCRKVAREVASSPKKRPMARVGKGSLRRLLGVCPYRDEPRELVEEAGVATGLAVTRHGGDLLPAEVAVMPGRGALVLTGKLGEVMQESAQAALSYIRSRASSFNLDADFNRRVDIHVHFPEGAIPKDGPSAGITMATALVSALLQVPVKREVAMTGEITLRGRVLPVGGIKDKVLAARRAGVETVLVPTDCERELSQIPAAVRRAVRVVPVRHMDEVLRLALRLTNPEQFLPSASEIMDWRVPQAPASRVAQ